MARKPPNRALHGPWPMEDVRKPATENAVLQAISNGTCECACCQHHGKSARLTVEWYWQRYPTPQQIRERGALENVPMNDRPVWIFDGKGLRI